MAAVLAVLLPLGIVQDLDGYASTQNQPAMLEQDGATCRADTDDGSECADIEPEVPRYRRSVRRVGVLRGRAGRSASRLTRRWHAVFLAHPPV